MKLNLKKKTFLFALFISISILLLLTSYLIFLLPKLYLDNLEKQSLLDSQMFHETFLKTGKYSDEYAPNISSSYIIKSPKDENILDIENGFGKVRITIKNKEVLNMLNYYKSLNFKDPNFKLDKRYSFNNFINILKEMNTTNDFGIELIDKNSSYKDNYGSSNIIVKNDYLIFHSYAEDNSNLYTINTGFSNKNGDLVISFNPYSTNKIDDIKIVAEKSLPTILSISVLITLVASVYFSKRIVKPIEKIVDHVYRLETFNNDDFEKLDLNTGDELETISEAIDENHQKLMVLYKNLDDELKSKDLFLKSSSHQLKTPLASSILLVESMSENIGKYKDRDKYLKVLKDELLNMQKMVLNILSIDKYKKDFKVDNVKVEDAVEKVLKLYTYQIEEKELEIYKSIQKVELETDEEIFIRVIDNLISNAIKYSPSSSKVNIIANEKYFQIENESDIDENLMEDIFRPFVKHDNKYDSTGLGLYVTKQYAQILSYKLNAYKDKGKVIFTISF